MFYKRKKPLPQQALSSHATTDRGRVRENNEDTFLHLPEHGLFAVIDGVGGQRGGETAAAIARDVLRQQLSRPAKDLPRQIREAIHLANSRIYREATRTPALKGMACVLTVAVVRDQRITIGHVGDTRLYEIYPGRIRQVTTDHSPVGERVWDGRLSEREAMDHARRHEIFRDVGSEPHDVDDEEFIDIEEIAFEDDAAILLCSDGLSDLVFSDEILHLVETHAGDPRACVEHLVDRANEEGGKDNITVILIEGKHFAEPAEPGGHARQMPRESPPEKSPPGAPRTKTPSPPVGQGLAGQASDVKRGKIKLLGRSLVRFLGLAALIAVSLWIGSRLGPGFGGPSAPPAPLRVAASGGDYSSISEALRRASAGQTVLVAPGDYYERLRLRHGVSVVSEIPLAAVLRLRPEMPMESGDGPATGDRFIAISATDVGDLRVRGLRVVGDDRHTLDVGLEFTDSSIEVEGMEIAGAGQAAIHIKGEDRSVFCYNHLHDNRVAVLIRDGAPSLRHNLISTSGGRNLAAVMIAAGARPQLIENRFRENSGRHVQLESDRLRNKIARWNNFSSQGDGRGQNIGVVPALDLSSLDLGDNNE